MSFGDIQFVKIDPETGKVSFGLVSKKLTGVEALMQLVVGTLFNNPGQDVLDPDNGASLTSFIGMNIDPNDSSELLTELSQRISKAKAEIKKFQIGLNIDPEEKLKDLKIIKVEKGQIDEVFIRIRIINESNQSIDTVV